MMKKYNAEADKLKSIYFPPYTILKAYIFSIILSILICSIIILPLFNLIYLTYFFKILLGVGLLTCILCFYLVMYFKDKILGLYNEEIKTMNLLYLRLYDISIVAIICLIFYIIYIIIF